MSVLEVSMETSFVDSINAFELTTKRREPRAFSLLIKMILYGGSSCVITSANKRKHSTRVRIREQKCSHRL